MASKKEAEVVDMDYRNPRGNGAGFSEGEIGLDFEP